MKGDKMKKDPVRNFLNKADKPTKWTLFLAVFGILSILAVGLTQSSYAAPNWDSIKSITSEAPDTSIQLLGTVWPDKITPFFAHSTSGTDQTKFPVYCLEHWKDFPGNVEFVRNDEEAKILDNGILALLTYANTKYADASGNISNENQAIIQVAIWVYESEAGITDSSAEQALPKTAAEIYADQNYGQAIKALVDYAKANKTAATEPTMQTAVDSNELSLSSDNKYYVSSPITVTSSPEGSLTNYTMAVNDAPEGTIVSINGLDKTIADLAGSTLTSSDKIVVKVPIEKVTEESKTINISFTGNFNYFKGYEYIATGTYADTYQKIVGAITVTKQISTSVPLSVKLKVEVPNTAQNSSPFLFIIGAIVLLSGAGIIYVNVTQKDE